ncbi:LptF/LptG family permease [Costertonia aggregata]
MFIFIFQTIWLFIDDLAGKGLDPVIFGKFFFYIMPSLTEKVLPLTVLLSSILTFGTFAENYEFAAMKASGISLQRSMRSLIVFVIFLGGVTFYFANSVIPAAEQKIYNLRKNIAKVKPAAIITEGVFTDLEGTGMNMKVDKKYGEEDRFLDGVVIHEKSKSNINVTVIKAETGELVSSEKSDILKLILKNGHYYNEVRSAKADKERKFPFTKANFDTYIINKDISDLNDVDLEEERNVSTDKMKNVARLVKDIDSLKDRTVEVINAFSKNISSRMGAFVPVSPKDTSKLKKESISSLDSLELTMEKPKLDTIATSSDIVSLYNEWQQQQLISSAKNSTTNILNSITGKKQELDRWYKIHRMHILSFHNKFALALSCIILFFVGAPLGAIIRKGGIGLPLVIAIILFLVYYFLGVFSNNYAKEGNISPILGAWLPTLIMLPLGIFLTKRATADKGLLTIGNVWDGIKALFKKKEKNSAV